MPWVRVPPRAAHFIVVLGVVELFALHFVVYHLTMIHAHMHTNHGGALIRQAKLT